MLKIPTALKASGVAGDYFRKKSFHRAARTFLKSLVQVLALPEGSYELRTSSGGPAVAGETVLHGEHLYVQVFESLQGEPRVLYRACASRGDYCGGTNHEARMRELESIENQSRFVKACRGLIQIGDELRLTA